MQVCEQLDDYLDGDLSTEESQSFKSHIENCEACRVAVLEYEQLATDIQTGFKSLDVPSRSADNDLKVVDVPLLTPKPTGGGKSTAKDRSRIQQVAVAWVAIAAVAACAITIGSIAWVQHRANQSRHGGVAGNSPSLPENDTPIDNDESANGSDVLDPPPVVEVKMRGDSLVIPVALEEDFTIVRVYQSRPAPSQIDADDDVNVEVEVGVAGDEVDQQESIQGLETESSANQ